MPVSYWNPAPSYKLCEMTIFPSRLTCPISSSESFSLLFSGQKDAGQLDNCRRKIWHQVSAVKLKTKRLAIFFFGKIRLASIAHIWIPNVRKHSAKQHASPSSNLKQRNRVPWLVPLTVYPSCLPNSPGRLGKMTSLGYKIPGFLVARLLQQQTASVQAGE